MLLVDSHCHLTFPDFADDLDAVVDRAREAGVGVMQTICTKMHEFDDVYAIAEKFDTIYSSVGVHPHEADKTTIVSVEAIIEKTKLPKVIGIGETGLDYYYEHSRRDAQHESFRNHIAAARKTGLPLIIHTREAEEDTVSILEEEMKKGAFSGLIHCFTSTDYLSDKMIDIGFYISFSGILTFKKTETLRASARRVPLDRILVETDAPYLAPVPMRGTRCEPAFTQYTNAVLAKAKDVSEEECARVTTENFFRLFKKAKRPAPSLPESA